MPRFAVWPRVRDSAALVRLVPAAREMVVQADLAMLGIRDFGGIAPNGRRAEVFFNDRPLTLARWPNDGEMRYRVTDAAVPSDWAEPPTNILPAGSMQSATSGASRTSISRSSSSRSTSA